jgi:glycosyltransferase involved in cell wall biosynthesis
MKYPVSVIIPAHNESQHIAAALGSVSWAAEHIVVDSFSTDDTKAIAEKLGAKVWQRAYTGPADQKNWAIPQATYPWVILLDADERVTPELAEEIQHWLAQTDIPYDAFWIGRQNYFMGKKINYSGWQNDAVVRLIRRDVCRYDDKQVHEEIKTQGIRVSRLRYRLDHFTYKSLDHFLEKMQRYARWSALDHAQKTGSITAYHLLLKPGFRFIKHFVLQRGFLDGLTGLIVSAIMAWGVFLRYVYLLEQRQNVKRG